MGNAHHQGSSCRPAGTVRHRAPDGGCGRIPVEWQAHICCAARQPRPPLVWSAIRSDRSSPPTQEAQHSRTSRRAPDSREHRGARALIRRAHHPVSVGGSVSRSVARSTARSGSSSRSSGSTSRSGSVSAKSVGVVTGLSLQPSKAKATLHARREVSHTLLRKFSLTKSQSPDTSTNRECSGFLGNEHWESDPGSGIRDQGSWRKSRGLASCVHLALPGALASRV